MNPMEWDAPYLVIVAALFGIVMARANGTYWLGRLVERGLNRTRVSALMDSAGYRHAVDRLNRWGPPVVSVSFLAIGVQTLINLAAGATRMPLRRYLPAVTVGCILWAFLYGTVGFIGWEALGLLWERSPALTLAIGATLTLAAGVFAAHRWRETRAREAVREAVLKPPVVP